MPSKQGNGILAKQTVMCIIGSWRGSILPVKVVTTVRLDIRKQLLHGAHHPACRIKLSEWKSNFDTY